MACSQGSDATSSSVTAPSLSSVTAPALPLQSLAATTGNGAPKGKLVFNWNLIGTPKDYSGGCGDGHRIFVERGDHNASILIQDADDGWRIVDCNGTGGSIAVMHSDELGRYDVYARILGKIGGTLHVCANVISDPTNPLCLLGTIDLKREKGQSKFAFQPDSLFDAELEDILWTVDTNLDFRIVQFRVYQTS